MNKLIAALGFLMLTCIGWSATLPVSVDLNRFLDEKHHTKFEINYQVKYNSLSFDSAAKGYFASLGVKIEILKADSIITEKSFVNRIGVSNQNDAESGMKSYLDKISLVLSGSQYRIRITFTDPKTQNSKIWMHDLAELPSTALLSDLEVSRAIAPADTTRYLEKFIRDNLVYMVEPSHLFYPVRQDSLYLYYQIYPERKITESEHTCSIEYRLIRDKQVIRTWSLTRSVNNTKVNMQEGISLKGLEYGLYDLEINIHLNKMTEKASTFFVLGEVKEELFSIMPNIDDEIKLISYFASKSKLTPIQSLSAEGKKRMVSQLWSSIAADLKMSEQDWFVQVKDRVSYANRYYSHFKPGWESDMGRIYIRFGAADDVRKEVTSDDTKFVQKDFQIWKYASGDKVYVFIDIQMNGNYKMIYAKNDEQERSQANWQRYLGSDYDEDELEKDTYKAPTE